MEKIYNISIVLSFLGLWLTSTIPGDLEIMIGFILIFSFGILHGSNDILLIDTISNQKTKFPFLKVIAIYLVTVLTAVILFYVLPTLALILFILFSAFHFGEQHWENKMLDTNTVIIRAYYFFYGLFILMLLFMFNQEEVLEVVKSITGNNISNQIIITIFIITSIVLILLSIVMIFKSDIFKSLIIKELFYLLVFAIVFEVSSLIWGFTIYFIFWHSIPSLFEQVNFIYGGFKKENVIMYLKKALPYWIISLIGITVVFFFLKKKKIFFLIFFLKKQKLFYAILFSFIAAVTFPHSLVISKMFQNKKTQSNT